MAAAPGMQEVSTQGAVPAKAVFLLQDLAFGGTQRQALELARRIDSDRFQVQVWTLMGGDDFAPLAQEWDIATFRFSRWKLLSPRTLFRLWRKLRREKPDLLVLFTVLPNIWGRIMGCLAGVRVIVANCRQSANPPRQHERTLRRFAKHMICNASSLKDLVVDRYGWKEERVTVIHNGVDLETFQPPAEPRPEDRKVVLCLARLVPDKDHETLVHAFKIVNERHSRAELWIVGNGPRRDVIRKLARKTLPEGCVKVMGAQLDVAQLLHDADVLVLSTHREGFPNAVAEAMAAGLPVVATDVDGLSELVQDEVTGLLIPSGNKTFLAAGINRLLSNPEERAAFGKAGRARVEQHFSFELMTAAHEDLFTQLLAEG